MSEITLTAAERNEIALINCCRDIHYKFIDLGDLLIENEARSHWASNRHESFKELVAMLGLSYSFATRLMGIARLVTSQQFTKEEILEIGVSKSCLLLPLKTVDEETRAIAKTAPYQELRKHLGHKVKDIEGTEYLLCPRCAYRINFHKGLLKVDRL